MPVIAHLRDRELRARRRVVRLALICGTLLLGAWILFPVFAKHRGSRIDGCLFSMKGALLGVEQFAIEHEGKLPYSATWQAQVSPYVRSGAPFGCYNTDDGSAKRYRGPFAMNPAISRHNIGEFAHPEQVIVLFDADETGRPVPRHGGWTHVGYLNGHVRAVEGVPPGL